MFYARLKELCKEKNLSATSFVEKELKMSKGNVSKWQSGNVPKSDTVQKIAAFFDVSTDYLLGNTDIKKAPSENIEGQEDIELDATSLRLLEIYNSLSDAKKLEMINDLEELYRETQKENQN